MGHSDDVSLFLTRLSSVKAHIPRSLMGIIHDYRGLLVTRFFLGVTEVYIPHT